MALFQAYYDASGSEASLRTGGLSVVGVVATEAKWLKFERDWERVLAEYRVDAHHMKHFTGPTPRTVFDGWDAPTRAKYYQALIASLKRGMQKAFAVNVEPDTLDEVNKHYQFTEHAYAFAANLCRRYAEKWVVQHHPSAALSHVFEHGDTGQGVLLQAAKLNDIITGLKFPLTIVPKKDGTGKRYRQFEAADMLAWEVRRAVLDSRSGHSFRGSLLAIGKHLPISGARLTAERVLRICASRPDIYPPRV